MAIEPIVKLKSLVELGDLSHEELLSHAQSLTLEMRGLRKHLDWLDRFDAMTSRPKDAAQN